jgi:hypothetical protein
MRAAAAVHPAVTAGHVCPRSHLPHPFPRRVFSSRCGCTFLCVCACVYGRGLLWIRACPGHHVDPTGICAACKCGVCTRCIMPLCCHVVVPFRAQATAPDGLGMRVWGSPTFAARSSRPMDNWTAAQREHLTARLVLVPREEEEDRDPSAAGPASRMLVYDTSIVTPMEARVRVPVLKVRGCRARGAGKAGGRMWGGGCGGGGAGGGRGVGVGGLPLVSAACATHSRARLALRMRSRLQSHSHAAVGMRAPRQEFDDHLSRLEEILSKLNALPTFAKCGCIDVDARGMHSSLRSEVGFSQHRGPLAPLAVPCVGWWLWGARRPAYISLWWLCLFPLFRFPRILRSRSGPLTWPTNLSSL